jgi:hypothetical protein
MKFPKAWAEHQRFIDGDQWPEPTEKTKNLPRPVFNICRMITTQKSSNVLNENLTMQYSPEELGESENLTAAAKGADQFTRYSKTLWERVEQSQLNEDAINDAVTNGTCIWHYFWNPIIKGGIETTYLGDIEGEIIDPSNIFFKNPKCQKVQKQPSIIISNDLLVTEVRKFAKDNGASEKDLKDIVSNENENTGKIYPADKARVKNGERVTVLTRYYKKNDRVYFTKSTEKVIIQPETDLGKGSANGFRLYPIELMPWYKRKKCIYGIGELKGLIPSQKAINFNIGMMLLSVQQTAWPKIIAKLGALNQILTNDPGELITDNLVNGQDNIKFMQPPNFSYMAVNIVDKIIDIVRTTSGTTEVATGEKLGASISAAAIIALQNQAKVPIETIQKRFYRSMKNIGRIWEEFFKVRYNTERSVTVKDAQGNEMPMKFIGSDYENMPFNLKIDVGPSSQFSESLSTSILERLYYEKGAISTRTFIDMLPDNLLPKQKLIKLMETEQTQNNSIDMNKVMSQLTPEEQTAVQANPALLQQIMGTGGNTPPMQLNQ